MLNTTWNINYMDLVNDVMINDKNTLLFIHDPTEPANEFIYRSFVQLSDFIEKRLGLNDQLRAAAYDMSEVRLHHRFYSDHKFMKNSFYIVSKDRASYPIFEDKEFSTNGMLRFAMKHIKGSFRLKKNLELTKEDEFVGLSLKGIKGLDLGSGDDTTADL